ncbi:MAG: phosphoenolpyruvate synthase [Candidatus Micrarchaeota archaeon]|nr:phosphoenolpyruvate synthase [Candidatus Micrarchaeota archaeon]
MENILWFSQVGKEDVGKVGGKGANLGEMAGVGLPVPNGFCTTSDAYFVFLKANGIDKAIAKITENLDVEDTQKLNAASDEIKALILSARMPDAIRTDIIKAYNKLCGVDVMPSESEEKYVAVRSSATAEDLPEASFAGQQETYLNIKGADNVLKAVQMCWASLFGSRAIYYRQEKGFDHLKVGLAAVVQEMVQSEKAGVMFTSDPITNDPNRISIEAAYGLGEIVVSGSVTPDRYTVKKDTMEIIERDIAQQTWMITKINGKNEHVNIKDEMQERQKLSDNEIIELANYGKEIEEHYGWPQDSEWAISRGQVFIVQSRPITTIKKGGGESVVEGGSSVANAEIILRGSGASPGVAVGKVKMIPTAKDIGRMEKGDILVTEMTSPDYVPAMKKAAAIITNSGGATCHAAIVSRELGVPCIVGTKEATKILHDGDLVTVDAKMGVVYKGKVDIAVAKKPEGGAGVVSAPLVTGTKIYLNLGEPELAEKMSSLNVDGVGLFRAEFMIAGIGLHPRKALEEHKEQEYTDKLAEGMRQMCAAFYPRPVVYRATDFKTNEYRNLEGGEKYEPKEENPMMGYRGCSRYTSEPDVFKLEVDAIRKVREVYGLKNLWLMIPMVRTIEEIRGVKKLLEKFGLERNRDFKLWIMVEVPSTIFLAEEFCQEGIDGISIGSNDLTQFILACDRDSSTLAAKFDERNEAILKALKHIIRICNKNGVTTSICGQAPSVYPEYSEKLVEFGINSISVNPDMVDVTRRNVASAEKKLMLKKLREFTDKDEGFEF